MLYDSVTWGTFINFLISKYYKNLGFNCMYGEGVKPLFFTQQM